MAKLLLLLALGPLHRANAQPTLREEAPEHGPDDRFTEGTRVRELFRTIDLDGDEKLDEHEVKTYFEKRGAPVSDGLWEKEDKNGDGVIDFHEFARGNDVDVEGEL